MTPLEDRTPEDEVLENTVRPGRFIKSLILLAYIGGISLFVYLVYLALYVRRD